VIGRGARLAVLGLVVGLLSPQASDVSAMVNASTANVGTLSAIALYSPTAPAGAPRGRTVSLTWTPSSPQNGSGYVVSGVNIGSNGAAACPASSSAYAFVGGVAAASLTDVTALAGGTQGTYVCYLVRSGYQTSAPSTWTVDPVWVSGDALPTATTPIGFFPDTLSFTNGGTAGRIDAGDTIVVTFDQAVDTASVPAITLICASVTTSTIYLGIAGGVATCPTAATVGLLTGMTLSNLQNADGRYAASGMWSNGNATLTITVGALSAGWRAVRIAAGTESFRAATTVTSATGAVPVCRTVICRPTTATRP
jgi:hypothetical protein